MKKLSVLFGVLAVLLSDAACALVAYEYCRITWEIKYCGTSAPAELAFLYGIPFAVGIVICVILAVVFAKKGKHKP